MSSFRRRSTNDFAEAGRTWSSSSARLQISISSIFAGPAIVGETSSFELPAGHERRLRDPDAAQAAVFASWLGELRTRFAGRILGVDARVADQWGRLNATASRNTVDSLIAATAHVHDLTVVTRNTKDFNGCEIPLLNPWEYESPEP